MHVLHRSHFGSAVAVTAIAALLAIVLTLAVASRLNDQTPAPARLAAPTSFTGAASATGHPAPSHTPFTRSPFSSFLTAPVVAPWAPRVQRGRA